MVDCIHNPGFGAFLLSGLALVKCCGSDKGFFPSRHAEAARGGLTGESGGNVRQGFLERRGVNSDAFYGFPRYLVLPGPQFLRVAHVGLDRVPDSVGLLLGLVNEGLELAQLPDFAFNLIDTHCAFLHIVLMLFVSGRFQKSFGSSWAAFSRGPLASIIAYVVSPFRAVLSAALLFPPDDAIIL